MDNRGWMMMRVFINRYNPSGAQALLKFLPEVERELLVNQQIQSKDLSPMLHQPQEFVEKMHYSWIKPLLTQFPDRLHSLVSSALTDEQLSGLGVTSRSPISLPVKTFILNQLYKLLKVEDRLPIAYLPETELTFLAKKSKSQLIHLIDFLGLYDLASEVRHIVNPLFLKKIYQCLTPKQTHYLKMCLHQKEILTSPKLGIDLAKLDCDKLKQILHRRGIVRLGRALCGQHPDLIWHIAHTLDTGRASLLLQSYQTEALPKITTILKQQVLNLMNYLKSE